MKLGRMVDVVCGSGLPVPWQLCFLYENTDAGVCFGHSRPQRISLVISFPSVNSYLD
jgi:hypothetical protein